MADQSIVPSKGPMAISKRSGGPSAAEIQIMKLLTILSETRQANVSEQALKIYAHQLMPYSPQHIVTALNELALTERKEGETAFPSLATVVDAVEVAAKRWRQREAYEARIQQEAEEEKWCREHPEEVRANQAWYRGLLKQVLDSHEAKRARANQDPKVQQVRQPEVDSDGRRG